MTLVLTMPATHAQALSCVKPDVTRSYYKWAFSQTIYEVAVGKLFPVEALPEKASPSPKPTHAKAIAYRFEGAIITSIKNIPLSTPVTVQPTCINAWCGAYPRIDGPAIYAFEKEGNTYLLRPSACGGDIFAQDVKKNTKIIRDCLTFGTCN